MISLPTRRLNLTHRDWCDLLFTVVAVVFFGVALMAGIALGPSVRGITSGQIADTAIPPAPKPVVGLPPVIQTHDTLREGHDTGCP